MMRYFTYDVKFYRIDSYPPVYCFPGNGAINGSTVAAIVSFSIVRASMRMQQAEINERIIIISYVIHWIKDLISFVSKDRFYIDLLSYTSA